LVTDLSRARQYGDVKPLRLIADPHPGAANMNFETVYDAEWGHVWLFLLRLGVSEVDLPDLTQDAFVQAFRSWERCDTARPIRPWLFGIAYRVMLGFRRLGRHRLEVVGEPSAPDPRPSGDEVIALAERRRLFLAVLEAMDIDRRAVFVLHEVEGYSAPEIAGILECPLNTVYSRLRVARREFNASVRRHRLTGVRDE
jgi:RNA polymerase sigma-70 factor, ECF subfamily